MAGLGFRLPASALAAALVAALAACATPSKPAPSTPQDQYRAWISEARRKHPYEESEARMHAVMMCESGGRPSIVNPAGPYTGLFQYAKATWNGAWNIYRNDGILDPRAQIFATALAWSLDMQNHWGCYRKTAAAG